MCCFRHSPLKQNRLFKRVRNWCKSRAETRTTDRGAEKQKFWVKIWKCRQFRRAVARLSRDANLLKQKPTGRLKKGASNQLENFSLCLNVRLTHWHSLYTSETETNTRPGLDCFTLRFTPGALLRHPRATQEGPTPTNPIVLKSDRYARLSVPLKKPPTGHFLPLHRCSCRPADSNRIFVSCALPPLDDKSNSLAEAKKNHFLLGNKNQKHVHVNRYIRCWASHHLSTAHYSARCVSDLKWPAVSFNATQAKKHFLRLKLAYSSSV